MQVIHIETNQGKDIDIKLVSAEDFEQINETKFYFDWTTEDPVYKLSLIESGEILGLMALDNFPSEQQRMEIKLLSVSKEIVGKNKKYDRIAGNLIAFSCRESVKLYGINALVSLLPKTKLKPHYIRLYGMQNAGRLVFLSGKPLLKLIQEYSI